MDVEPPVTFHELYQRHARNVWRYVLSLGADSAEAEDITAETFARCWSDFAKVRMPTVKAYLFTIARHLFLRGRRNHPPASLGPETEDRTDLARQIEQKSELETVLRWLQALPTIDREIFLLRTVHDLSYEEIAHIHKVTVSAAKVKVHRARLKLIRLRAQQEKP